ncbi:MAG: biotin--[acetyl-CoA-carboxylase] ligase [Oscillospiraceae bacterium]|jgi:BirA family biotin operon repressor/biotin-[acetyl-CoA-carboxylase] ligase
MELKKKVLSALEELKGENVSGAKLAQGLGVSRSAVWKTVKALQNDGYQINAVTNRGYCLNNDNDIISKESILPFLKGEAKNMEIIVLKTVDSTNNYAKKLAQNGAKQGTVVISEEQTAGKGRLGRSFYSPPADGIYMSVILRPELSLDKSLLITTSTAVAVSEAIDSVAGVETKIKWVNDIFLNGKKLCGILCEASMDMETHSLEYAVCGIGINVSENSFPENLQNIATSVCLSSKKTSRSELIGEVLNNMSQLYSSIDSGLFLEKYKKRSFILGEEIHVIKGDIKTKAKAVDIDENAMLIVEYTDGKRETLNSGEVSIRKI